MDELEGQVKYLKQYIQRQENLLLDYIRKTLDYELKNLILNASLQDMTSKYEESQKQVTIQNDLMQQAANSVESLTLEKNRLQQKESELNTTIDNLKKSLQDCKTEREKLLKEHNVLQITYDNFDKKYQDLKNEYDRQTQELSNSTKSKSKTINKKEQVILPDDEF